MTDNPKCCYDTMCDVCEHRAICDRKEALTTQRAELKKKVMYFLNSKVNFSSKEWKELEAIFDGKKMRASRLSDNSI